MPFNVKRQLQDEFLLSSTGSSSGISSSKKQGAVHVKRRKSNKGKELENQQEVQTSHPKVENTSFPSFDGLSHDPRLDQIESSFLNNSLEMTKDNLVHREEKKKKRQKSRVTKDQNLQNSSLVTREGCQDVSNIISNENHLAEETKEEQGDEEETQNVDAMENMTCDPYLLKDSTLCLEALKEHRWLNKQRTLAFCSRGVTPRQRHFLEDLKKLMPHCKSEPKWEKKGLLSDINEICESHACNNCVFLETRKNNDLYMWVARTPMGPSARFQVLNVHTLGELRMTGNCLLFSRPLLVFDKAFNYHPHLRVLKEMFVQTFGTPRNHPKSKPFFDHVFSFLYFDDKIWFRHYQISPLTERDANHPLRQCLTEIGPRFVLNLEKIFEDSFSGRIIFRNPHYLSPAKVRSLSLGSQSRKYAAKKAKENDRKIKKGKLVMSPDFLDRQNIFSHSSIAA